MAARRRILMISVVPPFPDDQGNRALTRRLMDQIVARGFDIDLVLQAGYDAAALRRHFGSHVEVMPTTPKEWRDPEEARLRERIKNIALDPRHFRGYQQVVAREIFRAANHFHPFEYISDETVEAVKVQLERNQHHSVLANYVYSLRPIFELRDYCDVPRSAVITHDALSRLDEQALEYGLDTTYRACSPEVERDCLNAADVVAAITDVEARHFERIGVESEIVLAEYGCFDAAARPVVSQANFAAKRLIFVASDNPLNRRGLDEFLLRAWPQIVAHEPNAKLVVAGPVSHHVPEQTLNASTLGVLSHDDLLAELRASSVVINPVSLGTGLKVKSVEAICLGLPLVSFAAGVEGLEDLRDGAYQLAEDWPQFAEVCVELLRDAELWQRLHAGSSVAGRERFSESRVYDALAKSMSWDAPQS